MVIKASSSTEIRTLVDALSGADDVQREAAIARLGIIGGRAVDRLSDAYTTASDRRTRIVILRALEAIGNQRSAPLARRAIGEGGDVAVAATGVLRTLLSSASTATATLALDTLVATTLESTHDRRLRQAAFDALHEAPPDVRVRVAEALRSDPRYRSDDAPDAITMPDGEAARAEAVWTDALEGRLPDTPEALREALRSRGGSAPLNTLRAMVDAVRIREQAGEGATRRGWLDLRGALHQALALRGSRVALYDLRESLEERPARLPTSFLAALHGIGDASCLEPIGAAWGEAEADTTADGARWRQQLASAFKAIVQREKITKRHAALKRVTARWPGLLQ